MGPHRKILELSLKGTSGGIYRQHEPEYLNVWKKAKLGAIEQTWVAQMSMFNYEITYKPGRATGNADCLSRYPVDGPGTSDEVGDIAISRVGVTKSPLVSSLVKMVEVEAKVQATKCYRDRRTINKSGSSSGIPIILF